MTSGTHSKAQRRAESQRKAAERRAAERRAFKRNRHDIAVRRRGGVVIVVVILIIVLLTGVESERHAPGQNGRRR